MAPAKNQGSFPCKGKEAISNPPTALDESEEAEYSESELFIEEEAQRDPDNECAPLINPWYDIRPHFPMIPYDYAPPPPGYVWLALCQQNPDVSWAPLASSIPNLVIRQGILLPMPIHFEFGLGTALDWREWVDNELSDMSFIRLLQ